jgi:DNA-binding transcriptional regulator YiaG
MSLVAHRGLLLLLGLYGSALAHAPRSRAPRIEVSATWHLSLRGGGGGVEGRFLHGGEDRDVVFIKKKPPPPPPAGAQAAKKAADETIPSMPNEVKQAIMKARMAKKMTQKQLAQALNEQASVIQKYEQGKQVPTNAQLAKIEKVLGTKLPRIKKAAGGQGELEPGDTHPALRVRSSGVP